MGMVNPPYWTLVSLTFLNVYPLLLGGILPFTFLKIDSPSSRSFISEFALLVPSGNLLFPLPEQNQLIQDQRL
uniref:Uncharacterized protein n=1 Tax=Picea glauca TaxID=3330 RepID=A0A117NIC9_PICGL|nr:hypothetical protein ABT39_MTgene2929 [Picea glauca]